MEELKTSIICAYYTAAFQRAKRLPRLKKIQKILSDIDNKTKPRRRMTAEEMLAVVKQLNAAFGGREV